MSETKLYWASGIAAGITKPWLWANSTGCLSLEEAKDIIKNAKENLGLISAWIDIFDENNKKETVYHECFIDALGNIR